MKTTYRGINFEVDPNVNKSIYGRLKSDTDNQKDDGTIRFYLSNRHKFFSNELVDFLNRTGIDWTKENEVLYYTISDDQIIIEGWYDIVGKVLHDKTVSFYWGDDLFTTNIFLGNDSRDGIYSEFSEHQTFRCDFSIVLKKDLLLNLSEFALP